MKRQCLEPPGLTVTPAAKGPGVPHQALPELVKSRAWIYVEMAVRRSKVFGSTPEKRRGMQKMAYDRWRAQDPTGETTMERFAGE